uniref:Predicted protein n=1 Tax=Hordeum vulgare subsp. vulgare TaxID=112509 RepID=F2CTU7_HORVV|nr:predicted protein [Hordeum vulgare subsp. vulgare]
MMDLTVHPGLRRHGGPRRRGRLRGGGGCPWRAPRRWWPAMWSVAASAMGGSWRSTGMVSPTSTSRNGGSRREPVRRGDDRSSTSRSMSSSSRRRHRNLPCCRRRMIIGSNGVAREQWGCSGAGG